MRAWRDQVRRGIAVSCVAGLLFATTHRGAAAEGSPDWEELEKTVREELAATGTPGAAVAVIREGRVVFSRGFGVANVETGEPVRPETLFRLASVTKMFTAATALTLAEQGKLKLDAPVSEQVSGLAPLVGKPTLHQLLSHTAGFSDGGEMDGPHDDAALPAEARSWKDELAFISPGRIFSYSNFGYILAGVAAGEAAGKPFADAVKSLVLKPLGMERSTFRPTETVTYPFAQGHHPGKDNKPELVRPYLDHSGTWPAGCLNSSVEELSRFALAFLDGGKLDGRQVLSPTVIRQMSSPHAAIPSSESGEQYGYGLVVSRFQGTPMLVHGGSRVGFGADLRLFPRQRAAVIVLDNRSGFTLHRSANRACELLGLGGSEATTQSPAPTPPAAPLSAYTGTFVHGPMTSEITAKDGKLWLREEGEELELKPYAPHRFKARDHGMFWFTFVLGADGKAEFIHRGHRAMRKVEQPAEVREAKCEVSRH